MSVEVKFIGRWVIPRICEEGWKMGLGKWTGDKAGWAQEPPSRWMHRTFLRGELLFDERIHRNSEFHGFSAYRCTFFHWLLFQNQCGVMYPMSFTHSVLVSLSCSSFLSSTCSNHKSIINNFLMNSSRGIVFLLLVVLLLMELFQEWTQMWEHVIICLDSTSNSISYISSPSLPFLCFPGLQRCHPVKYLYEHSFCIELKLLFL